MNDKDIYTVSGIYQIKNRLDGKRYVGSSYNIHKRWINHRSELNRNVSQCTYLQHAWNKYGEQNFEFTVLLIAPVDRLLDYEQAFIDKGNCSYNVSDIAGVPPNTTGYQHTEEAIDKIRAAKIGENNNNYGKPLPEDVKTKISESLSGRSLSDSHKRKISKSMTGKKRGPYSDEHKRAISEGRKRQIVRDRQSVQP